MIVAVQALFVEAPCDVRDFTSRGLRPQNIGPDAVGQDDYGCIYFPTLLRYLVIPPRRMVISKYHGLG